MAYQTPGSGIGFWRLLGRGLGVGVILAAGAVYILGATSDPRLQPVRELALDLSAPVTAFFGAPVRMVRRWGDDAGDFLDLAAYNAKLREDIVSLSQWREVALRLEAENAHLRALNKVTLAPRFDYITAQVVGNSGGAFTQSITINAGRAQGVRPGTVVMDGTAAIGRVVALGENAARVVLVTDASSRIPVVLQPGDIRALLIGDNTAQPKLQFLSKPGRVTKGQRVLTSNHGGVFPKGLPLGTVDALVENAVRVAPIADFRKLEFVRLVIERVDLTIDADAVLILQPDGKVEEEKAGPERENDDDAAEDEADAASEEGEG